MSSREIATSGRPGEVAEGELQEFGSSVITTKKRALRNYLHNWEYLIFFKQHATAKIHIGCQCGSFYLCKTLGEVRKAKIKSVGVLDE